MEAKLALIFDMDDTLYARSDPLIAAIRQFVGEDRPDLTPALEAADEEKLFRAFVLYGYDLYEPSMTGEVTMEEMYIYRMSRALRDFDMEVSDGEALKIQDYYFWHQGHIQLDPQIREALEVCVEKGVFLAIISNGKSDHQRDKYTAMGLERWFPPEQFMASGDIGVSKPDPVIFREAIRRWQPPEGNTWYIGDSYSHDIQASAPFGWHGIWLNKSDETVDESKLPVRPDYIVRSTGQLRDLLLELVSELTGRSRLSRE